MKKLLLFGALAFGFNAFGQTTNEFGNGKANRLYEDCLDKVRAENDGTTSNATECGCVSAVSDTLQIELDKIYDEKESQLKKALKSELYQEDQMLFDATIEQLKSLTTLRVAFEMERSAMMNIVEQNSIGGSGCFSVRQELYMTAQHIDEIRRLFLLEGE